MKFLIVFTLLIPCCTFVGLGQSAIDSLELQLQQMPDNAEKINALIAAAYQFEKNTPEKSITYGKRALILSNQLNFKKGVSKSLNCIGRGFKSHGDLDSAHHYFRKNLLIGLSENDQQIISSALMNIGTVFKSQGIYDSATLYYHQALKIAEENDDLEIRASCLNNLGNIVKDEGNTAKAIHYFSQVLEIRKQQKNPQSIANTFLNLGICYDLNKEYLVSQQYFTDALDIYTSLNDRSGMAKCNNNIAQSLQLQNKPQEAIPYVSEALQLQEELGDKNGIASTLYSLALLNNRLDNFDEAKQHSRQSLLLATEIGNRQIELNNYDLLQSLHGQDGDFKNAYEYLLRKSGLEDSLFNESKTRIINELQTKYETEKKEQQIRILNQENETKKLQRDIFLIGTIALIVILIASLLLYIQQQRIAKQRILIKDQKIAELLQEQTMKVYNAMVEGQEEERKRIAIDLHDRLGSMLSAVRAYFTAIKSNATPSGISNAQLHDKATSLLDLTFDELRKIANNLSTGMITNVGLQPAIEELCETLENGTGIRCNVLARDLGERIDNQTELGVYRIIQELLSNIHKHAQAKNITIQLNKIDTSLHVTVEDDGVGYDYSEKLKSAGMGLKNILTRVEKLSGKFHVDSAIGKGSFTFLEIPLREEGLDPSLQN